MNFAEIKILLKDNGIVILFLILIVIIVFLLYKRENLSDVSNNTVTSDTVADKYILADYGTNDENMVIKTETSNNFLYDPICFNDNFIFYINNKQHVNFKRLNENGTPYNQPWDTCAEGKIWSIGANNDSLYGRGTDGHLYYLPIVTTLKCDKWNHLHQEDIGTIVTTKNGTWISRTLLMPPVSEFYDSSQDKKKWTQFKQPIRNLKYDKETDKLWGRVNEGIFFSSDNGVKKTILTNSDTIYEYDVYNDNMFGFGISPDNKSINVYKYKKVTIEDIDTHILSEFAKFDIYLKAISVTKNYVFVLDNSNNLYVALVNDKATKTLIDADATKFKKHLTFDKPVEKLYSHPTCLYVLFADNTFGYIPLQKTDEELQKQFTSELATKELELSKLSDNKDVLQKQVLQLTDDLNKTKSESQKCSTSSEELSKNKTELEDKIKTLTANIDELNKKISEKEEDMKNRLKTDYDSKSKSDCDNRIKESENKSKSDCDIKTKDLLDNQNKTKSECDTKIKDIQSKLDDLTKNSEKSTEDLKNMDTLKTNNKYLLYANISTVICCCIIVMLLAVMKK